MKEQRRDGKLSQHVEQIISHHDENSQDKPPHVPRSFRDNSDRHAQDPQDERCHGKPQVFVVFHQTAQHVGVTPAGGVQSGHNVFVVRPLRCFDGEGLGQIDLKIIRGKCHLMMLCAVLGNMMNLAFI